MKLKFIFLFIIVLIFNPKSIIGVGIKLSGKIKLIFQDVDFLQKPRDFCVTGDNLFLIPDYNAGNIKIYESNGKLINVLGRKGVGPNEFVKPTFCFFDEGKFGVMDWGIRKIFIYDRIGQTKDFKRVKEISCFSLGTGIHLRNDKLFVSGYRPNEKSKPFDLYYIDLANNQINLLLPSYKKYGLKSFDEYETKYRRQPDIGVIGIGGWFDLHEDDVYFAWEGDLRIIKQNIRTGEVSYFGRKSANYVKPYATKKLINSISTRDFKTTQQEKAKMSFVRSIFTSKKHVLLVYEGPVKNDKNPGFMIQFYMFNGDFVEEIPIPGEPDRKMYFLKNKNILYSLTSELDEDLNEIHYMLKFDVYE
jgi:hypothetical protein